MDLGLRDRAVLVVGASGGVGAATARRLAAEGAHVALLARGEARPDIILADYNLPNGMNGIEGVAKRIPDASSPNEPAG